MKCNVSFLIDRKFSFLLRFLIGAFPPDKYRTKVPEQVKSAVVLLTKFSLRKFPRSHSDGKRNYSAT